ncbi:uncharacterized protein PHACADRAFT_97833, partial [Phanerochaete carnosa HHB-10118-sp]
RLVVYGCDEHSGVQELVTALLEEPFAPDIHKAVIRNRWEAGSEGLERVITYGYAPADHPASFRTPSSWLQQFLAPVELRELRSVPLSLVTNHGAVTKALLSSDVPVIVCNPVTTSIAKLYSELPLLLQHENAILVVVCSPEPASTFADAVLKHLPRSLSVVFTDPSRALGAIRILNTEPRSSIAVQRYQDNYAASGISKFTAALMQKLSIISSGGIGALYALSAKEQVKASLSACHATLKTAEEEVSTTTCSSIDLRCSVAELKERVESEVLGVNSANEVQRALNRARVEVKTVLDHLTWWRCIWRVDDIGETVKTAIDKAWCRELEDRVSVDHAFNDYPVLT